MKILICFFYFIIFVKIPIYGIIVLPFELRKKIKNNNREPDEYYLFTNIDIGEPPQKVDCEINFEVSEYYMTYSPKNIKPTYNTSFSKSLIKTDEQISSSHLFGYYAYEDFNFCYDFICKNKQKVKNISIPILSNEDKLFAFEIGLQARHFYTTSNSFIKILKLNKIINNYMWYFKFKDKSSGFIVIGAAPHEIEKENFKNYELKLGNTYSDNGKLDWCFYFRNGQTNNYTLNKLLKIKVTPNIKGLITTYDYLQNLEENFFYKYNEKEICEKRIINNAKSNYFKISCNKKEFLIKDIDNFPPLKLYNIIYNYTFLLEGRDLFIDNNDKLDLEILFEITSSKTEWKFGQIFLQKYLFVFDNDANLIGFYTPKVNLQKDDKTTQSTANKIIKFFVIFLFILLFLLLAFLLYRKIRMYKRRKILNNEIDDNFYYGVN